MSFVFRRTQDGATGRTLDRILLDDSQTMTVGQVVMSYSQTDDVITHGAAATPVLGILVAIVDKYGNPIPVTTVTAGTAAGTTTTSVTTAASNTTSKTYWGLVDSSRGSIYSASVSGTLGTTNNSNKRGCRLDVNSAGTTYTELLESTATRTIGTPANFYSYGVDPRDSTRLLVSLAMSEKDSVDE